MAIDESMFEVNENNKIVKVTTRSKIRQENLYHRGVVVAIENSKKEILIHKRAINENKFFSGYYDALVGGCVMIETYTKAAIREAYEEVGAKNIEVKYLFERKYEDQRLKVFFQVFKTVYDGKINIQKNEVEFARFVKKSELEELLKTQKFCPDRIGLIKEYLQNHYGK